MRFARGKRVERRRCHCGGGERTHDAASNSDTQTQRQLVLDRNSNSGGVLGGVTDDGEQDQSNELLRDPTASSQPVNRINKPFSGDGNEDRDHDEKSDGHRQRQLWNFFILLFLLRPGHTRLFHISGSSRVVVRVGLDKMGLATSLCRDTILLDFLHRRKAKEFPRLLLCAWSGAGSVPDCLGFDIVLVIVQALVGKELEDEVRDINWG